MEYPLLGNGKRKSENGKRKSVEGCQSFCDANSANDIFGNRLALTLQWKNGTGAKEITVWRGEHQGGTAWKICSVSKRVRTMLLCIKQWQSGIQHRIRKNYSTRHAGTNKKSEQRRHAHAIKMKSESREYSLPPRCDAYRAPVLKTDADKHTGTSNGQWKALIPHTQRRKEWWLSGFKSRWREENNVK